jgi:hypothetical protein
MTTQQAWRLREALVEQDRWRRVLVDSDPAFYGSAGEQDLLAAADAYIAATDRCYEVAVEVRGGA